MNKCRVCHQAETEWAWQPFGPDDDDPRCSFTLPGAHYRGFAVVKVCESCRVRIRRGDDVTFTHRGLTFLLHAAEVQVLTETSEISDTADPTDTRGADDEHAELAAADEDFPSDADAPDEVDELLGLAMAVANGWPRETAPTHVREAYIEAMKAHARSLVRKHRVRVLELRQRNLAEQGIDLATVEGWQIIE